MRQIKFRGKPKSGYNYGNDWLYGSLIQIDENNYGIVELSDISYDDNGYIDYSHTPVIPETVGQFTGLTDKNGKDIYEGDILHESYEDKMEPTGIGHVYIEVAFKNGSFGWIGEITKSFYPFEENESQFEVIGNIYDTPELIK